MAGFMVVTGLCQDCKDTACAEVCPVDCFYEPIAPDPANGLPDQLYIHPTECIECNLCVPACPWRAVFQKDETPAGFAEFITLNARVVEERDLFKKALKLKWTMCPTCWTKSNDGSPKCGCGAEYTHYDPSNEELTANDSRWSYVHNK
ncbi:MAG: ferredoxin family protein [Planctomycetes bacterium]|nr:ferredoxin family protein [Planctomycetota bacterium]